MGVVAGCASVVGSEMSTTLVLRRRLSAETLETFLKKSVSVAGTYRIAVPTVRIPLRNESLSQL